MKQKRFIFISEWNLHHNSIILLVKVLWSISISILELLSELKKKLTSDRFILILDEHTRLVVSLVCGKYELFDSGCVGIINYFIS